MRTDPIFSKNLAAIPSLYGIPLHQIAKRAKVQPQTVRRIADGIGNYWHEATMIKLVPVVNAIYSGKVQRVPKTLAGAMIQTKLDEEPARDCEPRSCFGSFMGGMFIMAMIIAGLFWIKGIPLVVSQEQTLVVVRPVCEDSASSGSSSGSSSADIEDTAFDLGDCGSLSVGGSCDDEY